MKVLLIDDDADQLFLRSLLLRHNGLTTVEAADRESALRLTLTEKPDCAVVDLRIPTEEAGLALIRELKKLDGDLRIIVLTGLSLSRFAKRPESRLVDEVIAKGSPSTHLIGSLKSLAAKPNR